jgi:hypothetical protein
MSRFLYYFFVTPFLAFPNLWIVLLLFFAFIERVFVLTLLIVLAFIRTMLQKFYSVYKEQGGGQHNELHWKTLFDIRELAEVIGTMFPSRQDISVQYRQSLTQQILQSFFLTMTQERDGKHMVRSAKAFTKVQRIQIVMAMLNRDLNSPPLRFAIPGTVANRESGPRNIAIQPPLPSTTTPIHHGRRSSSTASSSSTSLPPGSQVSPIMSAVSSDARKADLLTSGGGGGGGQGNHGSPFPRASTPGTAPTYPTTSALSSTSSSSSSSSSASSVLQSRSGAFASDNKKGLSAAAAAPQQFSKPRPPAHLQALTRRSEPGSPYRPPPLEQATAPEPKRPTPPAQASAKAGNGVRPSPSTTAPASAAAAHPPPVVVQEGVAPVPTKKMLRDALLEFLEKHNCSLSKPFSELLRDNQNDEEFRSLIMEFINDPKRFFKKALDGERLLVLNQTSSNINRLLNDDNHDGNASASAPAQRRRRPPSSSVKAAELVRELDLHPEFQDELARLIDIWTEKIDDWEEYEEELKRLEELIKEHEQQFVSLLIGARGYRQRHSTPVVIDDDDDDQDSNWQLFSQQQNTAPTVASTAAPPRPIAPPAAPTGKAQVLSAGDDGGGGGVVEVEFSRSPEGSEDDAQPHRATASAMTPPVPAAQRLSSTRSATSALKLPPSPDLAAPTHRTPAIVLVPQTPSSSSSSSSSTSSFSYLQRSYVLNTPPQGALRDFSSDSSSNNNNNFTNSLNITLNTPSNWTPNQGNPRHKEHSYPRMNSTRGQTAYFNKVLVPQLVKYGLITDRNFQVQEPQTEAELQNNSPVRQVLDQLKMTRAYETDRKRVDGVIDALISSPSTRQHVCGVQEVPKSQYIYCNSL